MCSNTVNSSSARSLKRRRMKCNHDRRRTLLHRCARLAGVVILLSSTTTTVLVQSLSTVAIQRPSSSSTSTKVARTLIVKKERRISTREPFVTDDHSLPLQNIKTNSPRSLSYESTYSGAVYTHNSNIDDEEFDDEDEDDEENSIYMIRDGLQKYHSLVQSTGSEIAQGELLQHQIKKVRKSSTAKFIQQYDTTANEMEVLAMNSITEQLPLPILRTLEPKQPTTMKPSVSKTEKSRASKVAPKYSENLNFEVNGRVSVEEEIYLAQMVQMGVKLQEVKQELQDQHNGEDISRAEWAHAVQMTPKQLRQVLIEIRKAKHQLVTANIGLVHTVVKQQFGQSGKAVGITSEELVQEGSIGLLRAAELFDPDRGVRFSTYAVTWIKGVLLNSHVTELVRVPSREKTKYNKIKKAQSDLMKTTLGGSSTLGSAASHKKKSLQQPTTTNANVEELALMTGLTVKDVIETQRRMNHVSNIYSLDYEQKMHSRSGSESSTIESTLTKQTSRMHDDDDLMDQMQLQTDVIAAMARNLDAREARLMRLRYGLSSSNDIDQYNGSNNYNVSGGRTLQECADAMGLSYSRVHQLNERCLKKLRQAVEAESLEEYLLTIA